MDHRNRDCSCDRRGNRRSGRSIRGVTQRGEQLSSGGASYRGSSRVPAEGADKLSAKEGHGSTMQVDLTMGRGREKAHQKPRSTNTEDQDEVTIFRMPIVLTEQLRRECNTRGQGHQGNYLTDSQNVATVY